MSRKKTAAEVILLTVLSFILPPCAVGCVTGFDGNFFLNLVLTLFGAVIIAVLHALFVVFYYKCLQNPTRREERRARRQEDRAVYHAVRQQQHQKHATYAIPPGGGKHYPQDTPVRYNNGLGNGPYEQTGPPPYARDDAYDEEPPNVE